MIVISKLVVCISKNQMSIVATSQIHAGTIYLEATCCAKSKPGDAYSSGLTHNGSSENGKKALWTLTNYYMGLGEDQLF